MKKPILVRRVVGLSMAPTIVPGQYVIASRLGMRRDRSLVIAIQNGREVIKRVGHYKNLPAGEYEAWLVGDNPEHSTDSRQYGYVPRQNILGVVIWPRGLRKRSNRV